MEPVQNIADPDVPANQTLSESELQTPGEPDLDTIDDKRHQDFYFDDGNVVLLAEETHFKVHKSVLSRHSVVFAEILSIPQVPDSMETDQYDSCPLVELSDTSEDLAYILSAMYDGINNGYPLKPITFDRASAYLRLGDKYLITSLQEQATRCFKDSFPTSLEKFDKFFEAYNEIVHNADEEFDPDSKPTFDIPDFPLYLCWQDLTLMVDLFKRYDLHDRLPLVFYLCSQASLSLLVDAQSYGDFTSEDLKRCICGRESMLEICSEVVQAAIKRCTGCEKKCAPPYLNGLLLPPRDPLTPFDDSCVGRTRSTTLVCSDCTRLIKRYYEKQRVATWRRLDTCFETDE